MAEGIERFYASEDGLRLRYLDLRPEVDEGRLPVVCLPGLTRPAEDFGPLARAIALQSATPRRVLAFDYRGRGGAEHDPDWRRYTLATERADFLRGLAGEGIAAAHFIGTSRGGLHIMALAAEHRALVRGAVFNDIGPVIEPVGLRRIKGYVGKQAAPASLDAAIALLKAGSAKGFTGLSDAEWRHFATTTFGDEATALRLRYDPALARTLDAFDLDEPLPDSWALFDKLHGVPVLTIRGENSDLLAPSTLEAMGRRWPGSETIVVPGQAHAPLLMDEPTITVIDRFLLKADAA